tara:strand:+ start:5021 stop:5533 length:513 start_codon:yes stop_codon:yes gene_type:complete
MKLRKEKMRKTINSLDIESSGFQGYPIQVGVIKESGEKYEALIKPHEEWLTDLEWNYNAQQTHGLELEHVIKAGEEILKVAKDLNEMLGNEDVFVDSAYDVMWLDLLFEFAEIQRTFHIFVLEKIMPKDFMDHWDFIFYRVMKEGKFKRHNALCDAIMNQRTFERIAAHF